MALWLWAFLMSTSCEHIMQLFQTLTWFYGWYIVIRYADESRQWALLVGILFNYFSHWPDFMGGIYCNKIRRWVPSMSTSCGHIIQLFQTLTWFYGWYIVIRYADESRQWALLVGILYSIISVTDLILWVVYCNKIRRWVPSTTYGFL